MKLVYSATSPNNSKPLIQLATFNSAPNRKLLRELKALMMAICKLGFLISLLVIICTATRRLSLANQLNYSKLLLTTTLAPDLGT